MANTLAADLSDTDDPSAASGATGGDRSRLLSHCSDPQESGSTPAERIRSRVAAMSYTAPHKPSTYSDLEDSRDRNKKSRGQILTPMCGLITVGVILLVGFALLCVILKIRLDKTRNTCLTVECHVLSGEVLSRTNLDLNPCQDFYRFACDAFNSPETRPPDTSEQNMFTQAADTTLARLRYLLASNGTEYKGVSSSSVAKAKRLYTACLNTSRTDSEGATSLLQLIRDIGSWPLTGDQSFGQWDASTWSMQEAMYAIQSRGFTPLFSLSVEVDVMNSSQHVITVDQSGLLLYSDKLYSSEDADKFRTAYINYFTDVMKLLREKDRMADAASVWDLERAVAGAFVRSEERVEVEQKYHVMSLTDFQALISARHSSFPLDMLDLTQRLINPSVTGSTKIIVEAPEYFRKVGLIIQTASPSTMSSYLVWCAVRSMVRHAGPGFETANLRFSSTLNGVSVQRPRWKQCVELTEDILGFASGALYVQDYFSPSDKQRVEGLINIMLEEFTEQLSVMDWMDNVTRQRAADKARAIKSKVGYPDFIQNPQKLDEYYETLEISDSTFDNVINSNRFYIRRNADKYRTVPDRLEWFGPPTEVNAFYGRSTNQITLPAGILQKPFYHATFPVSMLFGGLGFIVGHELTHGFDNNGRKFNKFGSMEDWWSEKSSVAYQQRSKCFREEYDGFTINGLKANGLTTLGENIADNGGARLSLAAYRRWLSISTDAHDSTGTLSGADHILPGLNMTRQQQLFLSMAQVWCSSATHEKVRYVILSDVHSVKLFRVNGVVRNIVEFSKAFHCSSADELNPRQRCTIW